MVTSAQIDANHNECDLSFISGLDASGNQLPLSSLTATLDSTADAYLANNPAALQTSVLVCKRPTMAGGKTETVNVTFNAKSQDGTAIPPVTIPVTLTTPVPPQATQIFVGGTSQGVMSPLPADPGSATVTLI